MDEEGNQFVAYFLPNEETLRKRKRDVDEELDYMPDELYVKFPAEILLYNMHITPIPPKLKRYLGILPRN